MTAETILAAWFIVETLAWGFIGDALATRALGEREAAFRRALGAITLTPVGERKEP